MGSHTLRAAVLTREAFAPFGDVIETENRASFPINNGSTLRFHDLAAVDVRQAGGRPLISIFRTEPVAQPFSVTMMERHPLSSQAFIALARAPFLVLVAPPGDGVHPPDLRLFLTNGRQGVSYRRGVWHHPVLALGRQMDFLVVDRGADDSNCDEFHFDAAEELVIAAIETD